MYSWLNGGPGATNELPNHMIVHFRTLSWSFSQIPKAVTSPAHRDRAPPWNQFLPANHGDCLRTEMLCIFCTLGSWSMMFDVNICLYQPMLLALLIEIFPIIKVLVCSFLVWNYFGFHLHVIAGPGLMKSPDHFMGYLSCAQPSRFTTVFNFAMWRFPKMVVPLNHPSQ